MHVRFDTEHRIVLVEFDAGAVVTIEDAKRSTAATIEVTGGQPRPALIDFGNLKGLSKECRRYYATDPDHVATYTAVAIVVGNALSRVIANFFLGINRPLKPTRLFDDRNAAIEWLTRFQPGSP